MVVSPHIDSATIWSISRVTPSFSAAVLTEPALEGFDVRDRRGKEGITLDDIRDGLAAIRWTVTTKLSG